MIRVRINSWVRLKRDRRRKPAVRNVDAAWQDPNSVICGNGRNLAELSDEVISQVPGKVLRLGQANDCGSFCLDFGDKRLKCFETLSNQRAEMVRQASDVLLRQGVPIPGVHFVEGHFVFSEWIDGETIDRRPLRETWDLMATYQSRIHNARVEYDENAGNQLLHLDWLIGRLKRFAHSHLYEPDVERVCEKVRNFAPQGLQVRVMMPDFLPSNLVEDANGQLVCIDNEFLAIGRGFEFDLINTLYVVFENNRTLRRKYMAKLAKIGDLEMFCRYREYWEIMFLAKKVGKQFQKGDVPTARVGFQQLQQRVANYEYKTVA
jgi:hypothetical protein